MLKTGPYKPINEHGDDDHFVIKNRITNKNVQNDVVEIVSRGAIKSNLVLRDI